MQFTKRDRGSGHTQSAEKDVRTLYRGMVKAVNNIHADDQGPQIVNAYVAVLKTAMDYHRWSAQLDAELAEG